MYHVVYYDNGIRKEGDYSGSAKELRSRLAAEGKVVIKVHKALNLFNRPPKSKDLATLLVALGDLLKAGVPLSKCLESIILSLSGGSPLTVILNDMKFAVKEGHALSSAMHHHVGIFGTTALSMIQAGEQSGRLAESLHDAAQYLDSVEKIQKEMRKKLFYPALIFVLALVSLLINTQLVIPRIINSPLFMTALKEKETFSARALAALTTIVPVILVAILLTAIVIAALYKSKREKLENLLFSIPMTKRLFFYQAYYVAFFSLSGLMKSGVQLSSALKIVQDSSKIVAIGNEFKNAIGKVKAGESFSYGFTCLDPIEKNMLDIAPNSERVTDNLALVADRFYRGYRESIQTLGPKVYVFALIVTGGIFLLMLMGIMIPYGKLLGGAHG